MIFGVTATKVDVAVVVTVEVTVSVVRDGKKTVWMIDG